MGKQIISDLSGVWRFWTNYKWFLIIILLFCLALAFYQKNPLASINSVALIVFIILFVLVIMIFNDRGPLGGSTYFAVNPLPPHLGLDGVSNDVKSSY